MGKPLKYFFSLCVSCLSFGLFDHQCILWYNSFEMQVEVGMCCNALVDSGKHYEKAMLMLFWISKILSAKLWVDLSGMKLNLCDVIKQIEWELTNTIFKIQPNKANNFFCFLLFVQSTNRLYLWNQLPNLCGVFAKLKPKQYHNRKCQKKKKSKILFFDFRLILLDRIIYNDALLFHWLCIIYSDPRKHCLVFRIVLRLAKVNLIGHSQPIFLIQNKMNEKKNNSDKSWWM